MNSRQSQQTVELLITQDSYARVSQTCVEVLTQNYFSGARASQAVIEVLQEVQPPTTPPPTFPPTTSAPTTLPPTTSPPTTPPTTAPTTEPIPVYYTIPATLAPFTTHETTPAPEDLYTTDPGSPIVPPTPCPEEIITPYIVTGAILELPIVTKTDVRCSQFSMEVFAGKLVYGEEPPIEDFDVFVETPIKSQTAISYIEDDV